MMRFLWFLSILCLPLGGACVPIAGGDDDTAAGDDDTAPAEPGPAGSYSGDIEGAVRATISGVPWEALCSGQSSVTVDAEGVASGTFLCGAAELASPVEGYFGNTEVPGDSGAQLQVGEATVRLEWAQQGGVPALALELEGSQPGPTGSDLSATIEIAGVLVLE
jgi:hypothetical protein